MPKTQWDKRSVAEAEGVNALCLEWNNTAPKGKPVKMSQKTDSEVKAMAQKLRDDWQKQMQKGVQAREQGGGDETGASVEAPGMSSSDS